MDLSDLFNFNDRITKDTVMLKDVNGKHYEREIKTGFNWLGGIFTWFYALFSQKYQTEGFIKKTAVPFVIGIVVNLVLQEISYALYGIANIAEVVRFGFMFDTWFQNQATLKKDNLKKLWLMMIKGLLFEAYIII